MTSRITIGRALGALAVLALLFGALHTPAPVRAAGNQRPLSDWLDAQGTTNVFFPPAPDLVGWANGDDPPLFPPLFGDTACRFALGDYTGSFAQYLIDNGGPDLGTEVTGSVTERALADGRAEVHIRTHAKNALTWVYDCSDGPWNTLVPILGNSVADVLDGAEPALGENDMDIILTNTAPGAPLPNLVRAAGNLCYLDDCPPDGVAVLLEHGSLRVTGGLHAAFGVPEGTRGRFQTVQTGFDVTACTLGGDFRHVGRRGGSNISDCFAIESMDVKVLGH